MSALSLEKSSCSRSSHMESFSCKTCKSELTGADDMPPVGSTQFVPPHSYCGLHNEIPIKARLWLQILHYVQNNSVSWGELLSCYNAIQVVINMCRCGCAFISSFQSHCSQGMWQFPSACNQKLTQITATHTIATHDSTRDPQLDIAERADMKLRVSARSTQSMRAHTL